MKKLYILSLVSLLFCPSIHSYWAGENFEKESQRVSIEVSGNTAKVVQTFSIKNLSEKNNTATWIETGQNISQEKIFVDLAAIQINKITDKNQKVSALWDSAKKYQDEKIFRFFSNKKDLLQSTDINFEPKQSKTVKIEFFTNLTPEANITQLILNNTNNWPNKHTKIHAFFASNPNIFYHFLPKPNTIHRGKQLHGLWESSNKSLQKPIVFLWSQASTATASWKTPFGKFMAHFKLYPAQVAHQKISVFLDTSGSMSDGKWNKTKQVLPQILQQFPNSQFRIGTISNAFKWWNKEFLPFGPELKKTIYDQTLHLSPVGKLDAKQIPETESDLNILITDEANFENKHKKNWIVLYLGLKNTHQDTQQTRSLNLFPYKETFIKKDDFIQKWKQFKEPIYLDQARSNVFPLSLSFFETDKNPVFWERDEGNTAESWKESPFWWTMQFWGKQRINQLISASQPKKHRDTNILSALLSIGKNFGVENFFFGPNTSQKQLQRWLWKLPETKITSERTKLKNQTEFLPNPNLKLANGRWTRKDKKNTWYAPNWFKKAKTPFIDEVLVFSETQKKLFEFWPEKFADYFSLGKKSAFCVSRKCFKVSDTKKTGKTKQPSNAVLMFLKQNQIPHWADEFVYRIAKNNALEVSNNGQFNVDQKMTRAQFAKMAVQYAGWKTTTTDDWQADDERLFPDVGLNQDFAPAVYTLLEKKIIKGYEDGNFYPHKPISRAEALKILFSMKKMKPYKWDARRNIFSDTNGWKKPWANLAYRKKIIVGVTEEGQKKFLPNNTISLGEAAKILVKIFDL